MILTIYNGRPPMFLFLALVRKYSRETIGQQKRKWEMWKLLHTQLSLQTLYFVHNNKNGSL